MPLSAYGGIGIAPNQVGSKLSRGAKGVIFRGMARGGRRGDGGRGGVWEGLYVSLVTHHNSMVVPAICTEA